jgi:sRNA-binding regulator protein Hfq
MKILKQWQKNTSFATAFLAYYSKNLAGAMSGTDNSRKNFYRKSRKLYIINAHSGDYMMKKLLSFSLMALLLHVGATQFPVFGQTNQDASRVEKIKGDVAKRGTGNKARVKVKLQNGSKLKGYISQAGDDSFTLTDSKTNQATTLAYRDVTQVKKQGGLSVVTMVGIGAAITAATLGILYWSFCSSNSGYC